MLAHFEAADATGWLNNEWVGRALRRQGFTEKRRVGKGVEYRLYESAVKEAALRMGLSAADIADIRGEIVI
jgi:hypothetical protein